MSGCDRAESPYFASSARPGIEPIIGHDPAHAEPGVELVVSTAIADDEPELAAARALGADGSELLERDRGAAPRDRGGGSARQDHHHRDGGGPPEGCGLEPGYLVGAELARRRERALGGGRVDGRRGGRVGPLVSSLSPEIAIVTSVELDHHTTYGSELEVREAFERSWGACPEDGTAVLWERRRRGPRPGDGS